MSLTIIQATKIILLFCFAMIATSILTDGALAQTTTSLSPVENSANFVLKFLTGAFARTIAIIVIAVVGFAGLKGRISWGIAGGVIIFIFCVFGGSTIVDAFIDAI